MKEINAECALVAMDLALLTELMQRPVPSELDLVDLARLLQRYRHNAAATQLHGCIRETLRRWQLDVAGLFERTRAIWAAGGPPQQGIRAAALLQGPTGSGSDVDG